MSCKGYERYGSEICAEVFEKESKQRSLDFSKTGKQGWLWYMVAQNAIITHNAAEKFILVYAAQVDC